MYKTHVMLNDAGRFQKSRQQFGTEQVEIAQQDSIPVFAVQPGTNERCIGLINGLALLRVLQGPTPPS